MIHQFEQCLQLGRLGEAFAVLALGARDDWQVERAAPTKVEQSDLGIDYVGRFGIHRGTIEIKTDMVGAKTGRIALELEHCMLNGSVKEGWLRKTTAALLVVLLVERQSLERIAAARSPMSPADHLFFGAMHVLAVPALRDLVETWREDRDCQMRAAKNGSYKTWNLCVPVRRVAESIAAVASYRVTYGARSGNLFAKAFDSPAQGVLCGGARRCS